MRRIFLVAVPVASLVLALFLSVASPREWDRIYAWKAWYRGHAEFEFTGLLRRNLRTDVFVGEDGSWEYLEGQPIEGSGHIFPAPVPECLYLLDRSSGRQTDLYVYSPKEIRRKTFLGIEEIETYDDASRCFRVLEELLGRSVTIRGWIREETIQTPMLPIPVRILVPGKIKAINLQGQD